MKTLKRILTSIIWTLASIYVLAIVLIHIPAVQVFIASKTEVALEKTLNTNVEIGRVDLGFLNRLIIDDVTIYDQAEKVMLKVSRLSVKVDYAPLVNGKISISSAQLFGIDGRFYKKDAQSEPNYQFAIDALAPKDTTEKTPLDVCVNSLIIRNGRVKYDRLDVPTTATIFNTNHISVRDISAHILMPYLTDDSLRLQVKKISMKEESGLDLRNLSFKLVADKEKATLSNFNIQLPSSEFNIENAEASYVFENDKLKEESVRFNGNISKTRISMPDIACFEPTLRCITTPLQLSANIYGNASKINVSDLRLYSSNKDFNLSADLYATLTENEQKWGISLKDLFASEHIISSVTDNLRGNDKSVPEVITHLGSIQLRGTADGKDKDINFNGNVTTNIGTATLDANMSDQSFTANVETDGIGLNQLLDNEKFGIIAGKITAKGTLSNNDLKYAEAKGTVSQFTYNSYIFSNISIDGILKDNIIDGTINVDDPNGKLDLASKLNIDKKNPSIQLTAHINDISPMAMRLSNQWGDAIFDAEIQADFKGNNINTAEGWLKVNDLSMSSKEKSYSLDQMLLTATNTPEGHVMTLESDFAEGSVSGKYDFSTIAQSITNIVKSKLPTLPGLPTKNISCDNELSFHLIIYSTDWANALLNLPLATHVPASITGNLNDNDHSLNLKANIPQFSYNDANYKNGSLIVSTKDIDSASTEEMLQLNMNVEKIMEKGKKMKLNIDAEALNNRLTTSIKWDNKSSNRIKGVFNTTSDFFMSESNKPAAHIKIQPSEVLINDTIWNISRSEIEYSDKRLKVDNFAIKHNAQHLTLSGVATNNATDSLVAELQDIDVSYILNIVNFHSVEFGGHASGKACVKSVFGTPKAYADLKVRRFTFEDGRMGTLTANARWNNEAKQIDIDAVANDGPSAATIVKGYVSPDRNYIDLGIEARNTNIEFLESFCGSFMKNIQANANGKVRLAGDLSYINLTGTLVANGKIDISTLNTTYRLANDTIRLIPNEIVFENDTVYDINGNIGIVNGQLHHKHLTRLTYDLSIDAENLLSYDFPDYNGSTFFGKVYATGNCKIKGRSGRIDFDISGHPEAGSFIEYDAATQTTIAKQDFIKWRDIKSDSIANDSTMREHEYEEEVKTDIASDLRINFAVDVNPDFTLRVLMDKRSGDYIALNGNGALKAEYYNKGSFNMYGNYLIESGVYKMTIRNIMNRIFQFTPGSTIIFSGDPYNATLDLNALYTLNSVPLSDLQIGNSFSSNNIRVDCLMNINGTPQSPHVDFDIDMPTINSDAKQMVRSLINSEEEMNQQVIYLLSIGRFYTSNGNNGDGEQMSQTSLAMQSFLSGTISQQINNVLSSVIKNNNWNFGANISTGDEGWNNAEYEGLMNGKFLNNRMIINGQFGYRDNKNATTSFIGDFDIRYLLFPNGNLAIKMYNQTNDRYFTKSSLNTQGLGIIIKKDFNSWADLFGIRRKEKESNNKK